MGVYLSEPNKDKHFADGSAPGFSFVSAEMQGTPLPTQVGARTWRMRQSTTPTSETATLSSLFLTDTEVPLPLLRLLGKQVRC